MTTRATTRTEKVYSQLRADILGGRLAPGVRLPFADLSERYGGSTSAIREGLQRLVELGLVISEPQQGFRVVTLSPADLTDLTVARCEIEGLALRYAIAHGDLAWESEIVAALYALERTSMGGDEYGQPLSEDWTSLHQRFHHALIAGCPNARLRGIASNLRDAAELYRHWSTRADAQKRDILGEHRGLADAVLVRDADLAVQLLEQHLQTTARLLVDRNSESGAAGAALLFD